MNFIKRISVLFCVTLSLFVYSFLIVYVLNWIDFFAVSDFMIVLYHDDQLKLIFGLLAIALLLQNYAFYQYFSVNVHRDRIIAFDNPSGRVSVSLRAMEDLIRRLLIKLPEIKEVKPRIIPSRKGLRVRVRLTLRSDVNIPNLTSQLQESVKRKLQNTIGVEEPLDISIYVGKILQEKARKPDADEESGGPKDDDQPLDVPFHGYRR